MFAGVGLGIGLLVAGLAFVFLVWLALRMLPENKIAVQPDALPTFSPEMASAVDAVLIIQPGGLVGYMNALARRLFDLPESETGDLERLARRVRPADQFLTICASPGQARITINGKLTEATSYVVPAEFPLVMVTLRNMELGSALAAQGGDSSTSILKVVTDFSQSIAGSLDLIATLQAILENVSRLIPSDILEIKIWDEESKTLIPHHFSDPLSPTRRAARAEKSQFGALTGKLMEARSPVLLNNLDPWADSSKDPTTLPIYSYLGIPLTAGGEIIGVLEVGQTGNTSFGQHDLDLLQMVSGQSAAALRNAMLYEKEERRAAELAGLAKLTQSFIAVSDVRDLFSRLVDSIAPLLDFDIVGFLLYDEDKRMLEGQVPFRGLPPHIVEIFRASVFMSSPAEKVLQSRQAILTLNASTDENWSALGFMDIAVAASIRDSALIPLVSATRVVGYLLASHHRRGPAPFTSDELRLLNIVGSQAAAIIENALLVQQARNRTLRSDSLRRIASLAASSAMIDEVLKYSIQELAHLFQADMGAIFLMDEKQGALNVHAPSVYGATENVLKSFSKIYVDQPEYRLTVSGSQRAFLTGRLSSDRRVTPPYRALAEALRMESALLVPLIARDRSIGELMLGSGKAEFFTAFDLQVVSTAAGQLAAALESASLLSQTDVSLRQQVERVSVVLRSGRELHSAPDFKSLLEIFHSEALRLSHATCGYIALFDAEKVTADVSVISGIGCVNVETLSPLDLKAIEQGGIIRISSFDAEGYQSPHADIQSALIVPILFHDQAVGVMQLHSDQAAFFTEDVADTVQSLSLQAATAIHNTLRHQRDQMRAEILERRAEALKRLSETGYSIASDQSLDQLCKSIAEGIRESTPFQVVLLSVHELDTGLLRRVAAAGIPPDTLSELMARKQPLAGLQQLMRPEFKISRSYFIPADQTPILPSETHTVTFDSQSSSLRHANSWDAEDFLLIPLENLDGQLLGLISLDEPSDDLRPSLDVIESVEAFASLAAFSLSTYMRSAELRSRVESLTAGIQRQQKLLSVTQNDVPILLRKDLEQTISLHNLDRRAQRVRAGLAITESVSRQLDSTSALMALARETLTQLSMAVAIVAENLADGPRLLHVLGSVPRSTNVEALFGQRNPLRVCLQSGDPLLVPSLEEDAEWRDAPLLTALRAKAFICLPVIVENKPVAAMLSISPEPMAAFTDEDRQVYFQISRQTSVILQNISLLSETRRRLQEVDLLLDFSHRLAGLSPDEIVHSLLDSSRRVLQAAHAGTVLLWDLQSERLAPRAAMGYADSESLMRISYASGEALPGSVFLSKKTRRVDEINFSRDYVLSAENLLLYRQATGGRIPVSSLLIPIISGDRGLGVMVLDNFNATGAFKPEDETLLLSLTQQVALSLENVRLVQATQVRAGQLQALNEIAASLTSNLRSDQLINSLLDQLAPVLQFDTATLLLREKDRLKVVAARGFPDSEKRLGVSVAVSDSALFNEMSRRGQPIIVDDVREDARFPRVDAPRLSWLGVPMISKGELTGVITLEKWLARAFNREQIQVAATFASQSAVALENASLYEDSLNRAAELDERSKRLALLNRFSASLSGSLDAEQILQMTAQEAVQAMGVKRVSIVTLEHDQAVWAVSSPRARFKLPRPLPRAPIFERLRDSMGVFTTDDVSKEPDLVQLTEMLGDATTSLLIVPLGIGSSLRGLLFAHAAERNSFGATEVDMARTMANQAAIALENARLYQSTVQTAERFSILNETSFQVGASLNPEEIYAAVHNAARRVMPVESFSINLLDEDMDEVVGVYLMDNDKRLPTTRIPRGEGLSGRVIASGEPALLHGAENVSAVGIVSYGRSDVPLSALAVPMKLGDKTQGALSAHSYEANVFTEGDMQILGTLANQAIVAIQNSRLFAETQRLAEQLERRVVERTAQLQREQQNTETLLRILTEVSSSLDLDRALNRTLSLLNDAIGAEQGTIMLLHADDGLLHYRAGYGYLTEKADTTASRGFTLKVGEGLAGWAVQSREPTLIPDLHQDSRWVRSSSSREHRSAIVAPMLVAEDVIGVLMVFQREPNFFSPDVLNLVRAIAGQVAVAINNAHLYELIRDQAERLGSMLRKEQEEASRSQAILEAVADGVLVTGSNNLITFVNASTERILGLNSDQLLGQPLDVFGGLFGQAAGDWMTTIRHWSEDPSSFEAGDSFAEQLELENGRITLVHLAPVILQNDFLGTVSIFRDVTHEVEVDRLKSEFVATVSHELRTPMTSIKGYVDILLMGAAGAISDNQSHFLTIVRSNIERLNILVGDLLDISRIEAGRVTLTPQPLELREVAEDVMADLLRRSQDEGKPMAISLDAGKNLPRVYGDMERVRQILGNLVDNAYHYTPENGTIRVKIHASNGSEVQVDVEDNGVGIAPEDQARVFERFYRGEHPLVLATPGTGLGLPIVRQLVEMHGGKIWMKSAGVPGEGSSFSFTLPVYKNK